MTFIIETAIAAVRILVAFYGFWLAWRALLPALPGPSEPTERIAPYARYFTDPWVAPLARVLRAPVWVVSAGMLIGVAALEVGLGRLAGML